MKNMKLTPLENWIMDRSGIRERRRELLEEYQLDRIRQTLTYAKKRSRFYGEQLKNIDIDEIRSLEDFRDIPFTFPRQIKNNPLDFLCVPQSEIQRIVTLKSSGTSGVEKRIFFTGEDLNHTIDFFTYGMQCLCDKTDRVMVLLPGSSYGSIGDLLKKALETISIPCFIHGVVTDPQKVINEIIENNSTCLVGIPMQVLYLSRQYSEIFKSRIRKVLLSTDYVPEVLIDDLTNRYGCKVFTHYGMTEMGYGGGVECEALNGYHMREADLFFEIINPESGKVVPDGECGEVVFTTLTRHAMPLIRYRTGDGAAFSSSPCPCGTFLKTMERVQGRLDNRIRIRDQWVYLKDLDEIVLSFPEVTDYKAYFSKEGCLNLEIAVECDEAFQKIKNEISVKIQNYAENRFGVKFEFPVLILQKSGLNKITNSISKRVIAGLKENET